MTKRIFESHDQNYWQLACIQGSAIGTSVLVGSGMISEQFGPGTALISIWIGNFILWLIGLAVVSMAAKKRKDAVQNICSFFGKSVSLITSCILTGAFLCWYVLQLQNTTDALGGVITGGDEELWSKYEGWVIKVLGLVTAILAVGGINLIKGFCVAALPFLLGFLAYAAVVSDYPIVFSGTWGFSLSATISVVALTLPGIVNLPTFFRHSKSHPNSILGLTWMTIFCAASESLVIFFGGFNSSTIFEMFSFGSSSVISSLLAVGFLVLSLICVNLVNIYFAAAGLKTLLPASWHKLGKYAYGLEGLLGLIATHAALPLAVIEEISGGFISNLGVVLVIALLIKYVVVHRIRKFDKNVNIGCWIVGCITIAIVMIGNKKTMSSVLISGVCGSSIAYLAVLFFEETLWAYKLIRKTKKSLQG